MDTCKIVTVNPNRNNIYLEVKMRDSNSYGNKGYEKILCPIADSLFIQRTNYPMTIIYLKLKYCGFAYSLFDMIFQESVCWRTGAFIPLILSISCCGA